MYAQYFLLLEDEDLLLSVFYIIKDILGFAVLFRQNKQFEDATADSCFHIDSMRK